MKNGRVAFTPSCWLAVNHFADLVRQLFVAEQRQTGSAHAAQLGELLKATAR